MFLPYEPISLTIKVPMLHVLPGNHSLLRGSSRSRFEFLRCPAFDSGLQWFPRARWRCISCWRGSWIPAGIRAATLCWCPPESSKMGRVDSGRCSWLPSFHLFNMFELVGCCLLLSRSTGKHGFSIQWFWHFPVNSVGQVGAMSSYNQACKPSD